MDQIFCWLILADNRKSTFMSALIQQPRIPSYGMMQASDVVIRAKEVGAVISFIISLCS